jgi:hypothetical protein
MLNRWTPVLTITLAAAIAVVTLAPVGTAQESETENGRFTIVVSPHARADTFLVDTASGKVWQLVKYTDLAGEPTVWDYMARVDNVADSQRILDAYGRKPPTQKQER